MRRLKDPKKIRQGIALDETAINCLGDPLPKMNTIHAWLGELYDQVHKQTITAGVPTHRNFGQQENEVIQHFAEMWDNKQYDVNCLPASMDKPNYLFTVQEPYISGTAVLHQPEAEELEVDLEEVSTLMQSSDAYSESDDDQDDGTTTAQESTDTEIREATVSVMISNNQDYRKLMGLSLEQSTTAVNAVRKAVEKVQTNNFILDVEAEITYYSQRSESTWRIVKFKESSLEWEEEPRNRRDAMPEREGARPKVKGRSKIKHQTASSQGTPECSLVAGYSTLTQ